MKDSVFYQAIVEEGVVKARQEYLLVIGTERFGAPDEFTETAVRSITDPERLAKLVREAFKASNWEQLLAKS
ncbi:MAG: hypothetical protein KY475_10440 [Planctomycetes bacterium]|nr:hypothetical protein [Planctomycetota bacterium]